MKMTRREMMHLLAGGASAAHLSRAFGQDGDLPANAPATAPALPPAPTPIPAPPGFGVAPGPFQPSWESLSAYQVPDRYRDAKFGIWAHWGPQCQPEMGDWYAQKMYQEKNAIYKSHVEKYGHPSKFGGARDVRPYTAEDIRFTAKGDWLYAFVMAWPADGKVTIKTLAQGSEHYPKDVGRAELLGNGGPLAFSRETTGLVVMLPQAKPNEYAYALRITPKQA